MMPAEFSRDWLRNLHAYGRQAVPHRTTLYGWRRPFGWPPSSRAEAWAPAKAQAAVNALEPSGTHEFAEEDTTVRVGDSGVTVSVTDLAVPLSDREVVVGRKKYVVPGFTSMAAATINGTGEADRIAVRQDASGNTLVEVDHERGTSTVNLGRIAALTLYGTGGDDSLKVSVDDYYGGVTIEGGAGDDTVEARVSMALKRAVRISGGDGDDELTLSGAGLSAVVEGGAGNDKMDASGLVAERELTRTFTGGAGSDVIRGSPGADTLQGNGGGDTLLGGAGDDRLSGNDGSDNLYGQQGNDVLLGGDAADLLLGGKGNDVIEGEAGADEIRGESGDDTLRGGDGDDAVYAGSGIDSMHGGDGTDNLGPLAWSRDDIVAYERVGDYLRVLVRDAEHAQERVTDHDYVEPYGDRKYLLDYDADEDYLVDVNRLVT